MEAEGVRLRGGGRELGGRELGGKLEIGRRTFYMTKVSMYNYINAQAFLLAHAEAGHALHTYGICMLIGAC